MTTMSYRSLPVFVGLVCLVAITGIRFEPGSWYVALDKPPLTPPDWLFPLTWTLLYLMIAVSGWLAWQTPDTVIKRYAFGCYGIHLLLNAAWSWIFFSQHWTVAGVVNIVLLLLAITLNIRLFLPLHTLAAVLLIPYLIWVGFALYLNIGIVLLN